MQRQLIDWFEEHKRDLPWREELSPYRVWVSEVMLQQTQVAVVIPYFERWMERFPTIESLANAPVEEVIKQWEGLGYYSRARNLHEGAKQVCRDYQGTLPDDPKLLEKIKGIGPYTKGAILSFAFRKKAAAVDGNVIRVLTRYLGMEEDISKPSTIKSIWKIAEELVPEQQPWSYNEGLIELGATVCSKKPQCLKCPIKEGCKGFLRGIADSLPVKSKKSETIDLYRDVVLIESEGEVLVRKCPKGEIMQDLYEFPFRELTNDAPDDEETLAWASKTFEMGLEFEESLPVITHGFTKYRVKLFPKKFKGLQKGKSSHYQWCSISELHHLPFNAGHRKIAAHLIYRSSCRSCPS